MATVRPIHTNPDILETAYLNFLNKSAFRPHKTSESAHRNGIFFKLLPRVVYKPIHTNPDEQICGFKNVRICEDETLWNVNYCNVWYPFIIFRMNTQSFLSHIQLEYMVMYLCMQWHLQKGIISIHEQLLSHV